MGELGELGGGLETTAEDRSRWFKDMGCDKDIATNRWLARLFRDIDRLLAANEAKAREIGSARDHQERLLISLERAEAEIARLLADNETKDIEINAWMRQAKKGEAEIALIRRLAAQIDGRQSAGESVGTVAATSASSNSVLSEAGTAAPPAFDQKHSDSIVHELGEPPASGPDAVARAISQHWYAWVGAPSIDKFTNEISAALTAAEKRGEERRFDIIAHLAHQREWSEKTFGPGPRTKGVIDHIRKELSEIEADPLDLKEWVDVIILAFDGAWRAGWEPDAIVKAIAAKQAKNESRKWPDWRTMPHDRAIEHDRAQPDERGGE